MKPIHQIIKQFQADIEAEIDRRTKETEGDLAGMDLLRYMEAKALVSAAEKLADDYKEAALLEARAMFPDGKGKIFGVPLSIQYTPTQYDWAQDRTWMDLNAACTLRIGELKTEILNGRQVVPIKSLPSAFIKVVLPK